MQFQLQIWALGLPYPLIGLSYTEYKNKHKSNKAKTPTIEKSLNKGKAKEQH